MDINFKFDKKLDENKKYLQSHVLNILYKKKRDCKQYFRKWNIILGTEKTKKLSIWRKNKIEKNLAWGGLI